jgi:PAS domain S-box-containing protein
MMKTGLNLQGKSKILVIIIAILISVFNALYAGFVEQVTIVYTHLFYIPILLAGMWYKRKGAVAVALFLGIVHILITYFSPLPLTANEFARAAIFVLVAYVIGYVSEERAKREVELSESEEKYRTLADNIYVGVFRTTSGPNGRFIEVNPAHIKIFGYERREEFLALTVADLYQNPDDRKKFNEKVLRDRFVRDEELQLKKKDGTPFFGSVSAVVVKDKQGKPKYYDGVIEDITERKRADDERDHLLNEIKTKNSELERFTYTVSHDLRSPLVTIQGFISMLQKDLEQNAREKAETDLKYIAKAATTMDTLLSDTLQLSRIGRVANPPDDVPFGEIVQGALEQTAEQIKSSGAEISVAEDLPTVHVDRMRIAEVLVNLIGNSIKYMSESASPKMAIGHYRKGKEAVFFVKDNGIGIDQSQFEKVFELFYKLDKNSKGTGAGLAIVKRIIDVHGGRIWIESEKGKGTTVCFTLPVVRV